MHTLTQGLSIKREHGSVVHIIYSIIIIIITSLSLLVSVSVSYPSIY